MWTNVPHTAQLFLMLIEKESRPTALVISLRFFYLLKILSTDIQGGTSLSVISRTHSFLPVPVAFQHFLTSFFTVSKTCFCFTNLCYDFTPHLIVALFGPSY